MMWRVCRLMLGLGLAIHLWVDLPTTTHAQDEKQWLYEQINSLRSQLGLNGYTRNGSLDAAAQAHADWMAATGIISHEEDNGSSPSDRAYANGYGGLWVSENIYGGTRATAQTAWVWWLNSSIHYSAITHSAKTDVGIGIAAGDGMRYYTLLFGEGSGGGIPFVPSLPTQVAENAESVGVSNDVAVPLVPEVAIQPPPPTSPPQPVQPLITFTPSPTIPTQTPTITWTPTFTWTPSPTTTAAPPTTTPIILATARPLAALLTDTPTLTPAPTNTAIMVALSPRIDEYTPSPPNEVTLPESKKGFNWRIILPVLITAQGLGLGWVIWRLLRYAQGK